MNSYLKENVLEAARKRIARLYDEFESIAVSSSGGKDSTVIMHLTLDEARRRGRLPLIVYWLDQEAEWECTVDYMRSVKEIPGVDLHWLQVPFRLFNATNTEQPWTWAWGPQGNWMREKEPDSIHECPVISDRFKQALTDYQTKHLFPGKRGAAIVGVRTQESMIRRMSINHRTYKDISWGSRLNEGLHYKFWPIYDWRVSDVWKYIHETGVKYNKLYDYMLQNNVPFPNMRCSNMNHENGLRSLYYMQEIEPNTWEKLVQRMNGINGAKHFAHDLASIDPPNGMSIVEYRDYLLNWYVEDYNQRVVYARRFSNDLAWYEPEHYDKLHRAQVTELLTNDIDGQRTNNLKASSYSFLKRKPKRAYEPAYQQQSI